jgi:hypothetical protein
MSSCSSSPAALIRVDSKLRLNPTTTDPSSCIIPSVEVLSGTYSLKSIFLPITYYNINSTNNQIYFNDGTARVASIPVGYYSSLSDLGTAAAAAMATFGSTITASLNALTNMLTITSNLAFTFTFGSFTTNSAATVLGFIGDSTVSQLTQTGTVVMNLSTTTSYNFQLSNSSSNVRTMDGKNFTFCIPALTNTPTNMYYEPPAQFPIIFHLDATQALRINIFDDQFRVLNNMRSDFYFVLQKLGS